MKMYSSMPGLRRRQVIGDLVVLVWGVVWANLGAKLSDVLSQLSKPALKARDAGASIEGRLGDAASAAGRVPLLGDDLTKPLQAAADAGEDLRLAGVLLDNTIQHVAHWMGFGVAIVPILIALAIWVPLRVRRSREAEDAMVLLVRNPNLLALRGLVGRPVHELAHLPENTLERILAGDEDLVNALAVEEATRLGAMPSSR